MTGKIYYTPFLSSITLIYPFYNPFWSYNFKDPAPHIPRDRSLKSCILLFTPHFL